MAVTAYSANKAYLFKGTASGLEAGMIDVDTDAYTVIDGQAGVETLGNI